MPIKRNYTTISIDYNIFDKLYELKAQLLRGDRDKSWNNFFYKVSDVLDDYVNIHD